jgi:hypothetical protein
MSQQAIVQRTFDEIIDNGNRDIADELFATWHSADVERRVAAPKARN